MGIWWFSAAMEQVAEDVVRFSSPVAFNVSQH
jgi:hypothetical protein